MKQELIEKLVKIQREQVPWVQHNFGERPATQPLLGMMEEMSEFQEDFGKDTVKEIDAICDLAIFGLDYLTALGIGIREVMSDEYERASLANSNFVWMIYYVLGKICHHQLKMDQNIRTTELHTDLIKMYMNAVYQYLELFMNQVDGEFEDHLQVTWDEVSQRDWKADKENGNG